MSLALASETLRLIGRLDDDEAADDSEEEAIRRQMEEQAEAEQAEDLDIRDMAEPEPGSGGIAGRQIGPSALDGASFPAPL